MTTFGDALQFEWVKLRTIRSTWVVLALLAAVLPALSFLVGVTGSVQPDDTVTGASLLGGSVLGLLLAGAFGAGTITSEHRHGTIRSTMTALPRPGVVVAAKGVVSGGLVGLVAVPSALAAIAVGHRFLGDHHADGSVLASTLGIAVVLATTAVLGVALGTVVRQPAAAVGAVVGVVLLPSIVGPLLGDLQRWVGGASLSGVVQKVAFSSDATPETVGSLGAAASLGVAAAHSAAAMVVATLVHRSRNS